MSSWSVSGIVTLALVLVTDWTDAGITEKTLLQRIAIRCNLYAVIGLQRSNTRNFTALIVSAVKFYSGCKILQHYSKVLQHKLVL